MKAVRRRVVVSGIGVLSAVGIGRDAFWSGVHSARSPVRRIDRFDPASFRSQVAAQIDDFEPLDHMDGRAARTPLGVMWKTGGRLRNTDAITVMVRGTDMTVSYRSDQNGLRNPRVTALEAATAPA